MAITVNKGYLGRGWDFPFSFSTSGGVSTAEYEKKIKLNMLTVLTTEAGTRFMAPNFGSTINSQIFEPEDYLTYTAIRNAIVTALNIFVSLIDIVDVTVDFNHKQDNYVPITVKYKLKYSNDLQNLVYPFYRPEQT